MAEATFPRTHFDETIQQQDLIVINPPIAWLAGYCQLYFDHEEFPAPRAVRALSSGIDGVSLRRTSDRTIEVSPRKGYITPTECVDGGACEPVCPVNAIFFEADVPQLAEALINFGFRIFNNVALIRRHFI